MCQGDRQEMAQSLVTWPSYGGRPLHRARYKHDPPLEGRNGMAKFQRQGSGLSDIAAFRDRN